MNVHQHHQRQPASQQRGVWFKRLLTTASGPRAVSVPSQLTAISVNSVNFGRQSTQHLIIGATAADKLEGNLTWGVCQSPPFPPPPPIVSPPVFHPFPSLLFFPSAFKFSKKVRGSTKLPTAPREKMKGSCKSWRGQNTLGHRCLQSWSGRVPRVPWSGCTYAFVKLHVSLGRPMLTVACRVCC